MSLMVWESSSNNFLVNSKQHENGEVAEEWKENLTKRENTRK